MIETILRKRTAAHVGEAGLFPSSEMAAEDLALIGMGNDVTVTVRSEAAEQIRKFMWALATVVGRSVEGCHDKDDGMELLCIKCRHMTHKLDPVTGKLEIKRKSTLRISGEAQLRLLNRMLYVTVAELIPGVAEKSLRSKLEQMAGAAYPTIAPQADVQRKSTRRPPKPRPANETQPTGRRSEGDGDLRDVGRLAAAIEQSMEEAQRDATGLDLTNTTYHETSHD